MPSNGNSNLVTAQILEVCINGAGKARIICQANLNSTTGTHYLNNLIENGLLEAIHDGPKFIYKTTPKGLELKECLGQYKSMMDHRYSHA